VEGGTFEYRGPVTCLKRVDNVPGSLGDDRRLHPMRKLPKLCQWTSKLFDAEQYEHRNAFGLRH
jgi:hypothetical protein